MRRRNLLAVLTGLVVLAAGGAVLLWPPEERIARANYDRIEKGMTLSEMEAIPGPPKLQPCSFLNRKALPSVGHADHPISFPSHLPASIIA